MMETQEEHDLRERTARTATMIERFKRLGQAMEDVEPYLVDAEKMALEPVRRMVDACALGDL